MALPVQKSHLLVARGRFVVTSEGLFVGLAFDTYEEAEREARTWHAGAVARHSAGAVTYVSVLYRHDAPSDCVCCSDVRGHGHVFCHAIHDLDDRSATHSDVLREAISAADVRDGDEFEVLVRKTGRRPFGDRLVLHRYLNGQNVSPTLIREPDTILRGPR